MGFADSLVRAGFMRKVFGECFGTYTA